MSIGICIFYSTLNVEAANDLCDAMIQGIGSNGTWLVLLEYSCLSTSKAKYQQKLIKLGNRTDAVTRLESISMTGI